MIFLSRSLYIASLFRGISDLLPVMPFSRFASFPAWVTPESRIQYVAFLFPGIGAAWVISALRIRYIAFLFHGMSAACVSIRPQIRYIAFLLHDMVQVKKRRLSNSKYHISKTDSLLHYIIGKIKKGCRITTAPSI